MIDHFVNFPDETAAKADPVVGAYFVEDAWRGDIVIPGVAVYRITGSETVTPPEGEGDPYEREIREPYPGWFALIALPELSAAIRDLPEAGCFIIADRVAATSGVEDFILYQSPALSDADRAISRAEPVFAGADYPFHRSQLREAA